MPRVVPRALRVWAVFLAATAAAGTLAVWRYFVGSTTGQALDQMAFDGATYGRGTLWVVAEPVLDVVSISFVVVGMTVAMGIALVRRRWNLAAQVVVLVVGANLTTQVLKKFVLDRPDLGYDSWGNSLPSGHTTVAASVSVALVLAVPRGARPLVALFGATYTVATGISTLVGQWHRPSDVIAAMLVVLAWGALVCAFSSESALDPLSERPVVLESPRDYQMHSSSTTLAVALLAVVGVAAGAIAGWALLETASIVSGETAARGRSGFIAYVGGAGGVAAVTALVFALLLGLRQGVARPWRRPSRCDGHSQRP
ncbi:PAP2 superfamily protein [Sanguibacter antarcticus]|uniref:PAP2 superfamily protein n=1 Tax=Sanguibacter antarcticus TaxID=372484 RepID=A0A2A9E9I6_9MICO|nr:PAP2 superfamily protein [Sanguibacter antarcticus]